MFLGTLHSQLYEDLHIFIENVVWNIDTWIKSGGNYNLCGCIWGYSVILFIADLFCSDIFVELEFQRIPLLAFVLTFLRCFT